MAKNNGQYHEYVKIDSTAKKAGKAALGALAETLYSLAQRYVNSKLKF